MPVYSTPGAVEQETCITAELFVDSYKLQKKSFNNS